MRESFNNPVELRNETAENTGQINTEEISRLSGEIINLVDSVCEDNKTKILLFKLAKYYTLSINGDEEAKKITDNLYDAIDNKLDNPDVVYTQLEIFCNNTKNNVYEFPQKGTHETGEVKQHIA